MGFLGDVVGDIGNVVSGIGKAANSVFGAETGLGSQGLASMPKYQATGTDSATQGLLSQEQGKSNRSTGEFANDLTANTNKGASLLSPEAANRQSAALGSSSPDGLSQAIQNKSSRAFESNQAKINQAAQTQAVAMKNQLMSAVTNDYMNQQHAELGNLQQQNQVAQDYSNARNGIISNLFGGAGGAIGMYASMKKTSGAGGNQGSGVIPMSSPSPMQASVNEGYDNYREIS